MSKLEELRQSIDQIDQELVRLFERRMAVTREVGEYKQQVGLPVLDAAREREVLAKKLNLISNPDLQADVVQLYENIMAISRRQQRSLVLEGQENPYLTKILGDIARAEAPIETPVWSTRGNRARTARWPPWTSSARTSTRWGWNSSRTCS